MCEKRTLDDFDYNTDWRLRDKILGIDDRTVGRKSIAGPEPRGASVEHFTNLSVESLVDLVKLKFADKTQCQNDSPTIGEFLIIGQDAKEHMVDVAYTGYAVSINRDDYRVSIEGIDLDYTPGTNPKGDGDALNAIFNAAAATRDASTWDLIHNGNTIEFSCWYT